MALAIKNRGQDGCCNVRGTKTNLVVVLVLFGRQLRIAPAAVYTYPWSELSCKLLFFSLHFG